LLIGFVSSPRTAVMRLSFTSTRMPQLWLQRTQTVGRFVPFVSAIPVMRCLRRRAAPPSVRFVPSASPRGARAVMLRAWTASPPVLAREPERRRVPARLVDPLDRRSLPAGHVLVAPLGDGDDDAVEVEPLLRQPILPARRARLVALAPEHAVLDQLRQAIGEPVAAHAEARLKAFEAALPEERVAQDEQRPSDRRRRKSARAIVQSSFPTSCQRTADLSFQNGT
jgi:hypothetical protein